MDEVKTAVHAFIMSEFLIGESPDTLTDSTKLISSGIVDSLATLRLVAFLEETFGIKVEAHEMGPENLDTLITIEAFVSSKKG